MKNPQKTGSHSDDDTSWAIHVVDPALDGLHVGWNDDSGTENGNRKATRIGFDKILSDSFSECVRVWPFVDESKRQTKLLLKRQWRLIFDLLWRHGVQGFFI